LFVADDGKLIFADLETTRLVGRLHDLAGDRVDQLLTQPVAGGAVDLAKRDALGGGDRRVEGNRARDQRQLEIATPICARGHRGTPSSAPTDKSSSLLPGF